MTRIPAAVLALTLAATLAEAQVQQTFESGQGDWYADNGVWEIGTPTAGPPACHEGTRCAGTVLGGNYPKNNSRLVSPPIQLAQGTVQNPVRLRFWHWFSWAAVGLFSDYGVVQISAYDPTLSTWSAWTDVSPVFSGVSSIWTLTLVDLTSFSGRLVRIGFYQHGTQASFGAASTGWYLDDIEVDGTPIPSATFATLQDFETGQGDWSADNGVWQVGTPTAGPPACQEGTRCAGTVLGGNYPKTNSRLISPPIQLAWATAQNPVRLRFWHWFSWAAVGLFSDLGVVQISAFDPMRSTWSAWTNVSPVFSGVSSVWTLTLVDLTPFSGRLVRIGFYHQGAVAPFSAASTGWYLDDIAIGGGVPGAPPTISDIANQTVNQSTSTGPLAFTVGDGDTPASALTVSGASSNAALVPPSGIVFGGSGTNRTVTVTPAAGQTGTATITVTVTDGDGLTASDPFLLTVVATGDTDGDGLPDDWETQYGLDPTSAAGDNGATGDPDADGATNLAEYQGGTHPRGFHKRYLAEGALNAFFDVRLALLNVGTANARTLIRFLQPGGATLPRFELLAPLRRRTLTRTDLSGLSSPDFSTVVESDQPVVLDRTMSWDASGFGSHAESGVASPSTTWYLAEGSTSGDFALFYLLQNPNPIATVATVRYLRPSGLPPIERQYALTAHSRLTIPVDLQGPELASTDLSAVITAPLPIIAERAMYMTRLGQPFAAGHGSAGVTAPATSWFLAEGATGPFFDLFILLANPGAQAAQVTVDYLLLGGATYSKAYTVPANGRATIWVDDEQIPAGSGVKPLDNVAVSSTISSTNGVPIIVERTMWWPSPALTPAFWAEAHNSPGATSTATRWALAEGEVGGTQGAETYILIANPSAAAGDVRVRLCFEDGTAAERTFTLPGRSRTNVSVSTEFPAAAGRRFGALVESLGGTPAQIVVERAMYTSPGGQTWSAGTNALATPLP